MVKVSLKIAPFQIYPSGVTISNSEPKKNIYPRNQKMFHSKKAIIYAEKYLIREEHYLFSIIKVNLTLALLNFRFSYSAV